MAWLSLVSGLVQSQFCCDWQLSVVFQSGKLAVTVAGRHDTGLPMSDDELKSAAREFVKRNHKNITENHAALNLVPPVSQPETILMAGPPGAGKTEFAEELIAQWEAARFSEICSFGSRFYPRRVRRLYR